MLKSFSAHRPYKKKQWIHLACGPRLADHCLPVFLFHYWFLKLFYSTLITRKHTWDFHFLATGYYRDDIKCFDIPKNACWSLGAGRKKCSKNHEWVYKEIRKMDEDGNTMKPESRKNQASKPLGHPRGKYWSVGMQDFKIGGRQCNASGLHPAETWTNSHKAHNKS